MKLRLPGLGTGPALALAVLIMGAGTLGALLAAYLQGRHNETVQTQAFDEQAQRTVQQIRSRMLRYDAGLHGLRGAVLAAGGRSLRQEQLRVYSDSRDMNREFPGARGFGVIWRVPVAQEADFVAAARADGRPEFRILQIQAHGDERKVITFIEPQAVNRTALGLDIASEPSRNAAAQASARSGEATLTAPITLVQATGKQMRGLLLMLPIYQPKARLETQAEREAATMGWTYTPLVVDDVLAGLDGEGQRFHLKLFTPAAPGERAKQFYGEPFERVGHESLPIATRSLEVHGQRWEAQLQATPEFIAGLNLTEPRRVAVTIGLLSLLLAAVAFLLASGRARSQRERLEVARRAAIVEGSQDAIIGATLDGVITEWNSSAQRLFGYNAEEALGRSVEDLLLPPDRLAEDEQLRATIASGQRMPPFETVRLHRDGSPIAVLLTAGPILDGKGHCVGMAKSLRDVREAQRARAELAELNASLEAQVASRTAALVTALRDNSALLQTLNRFAIVAVTDPGGTIREVNAPFCQVSGYEAEELVGSTHHVLDSGYHAPDFWAAMRAKVHAGDAWRGEICNRAKDGSTFWIDCIVAPFLDAEGEIEHFISISTDITPIKRLQQEAERARLAAEEANRFLQEVTDRLPLRISYLDRDHRFRFVNAAQCDAYGLPREALLGQQPQVFEHGLPPPALRDIFSAVLAGQARSFEADVPSVQGGAVSHEVRLVPDLRNDEVVGYYSVGTDISVRKRAEEELRRTLSTLRAVLDAATQVSILSAGVDGRIRLFNRGAEKLTGYQASEVIGRDALTLLHDPDELAERCNTLSAEWGEPVGVRRSFIDPRVIGTPRDWHYRCKDGRRVPVSVAVTPILDDSGHAVGYLGIASDISARQQFEHSLREAMHRANEANHAKSQFLANMSHEIRTPMNAVIGLSYLLERTRLDAEQAGFVTKIKLASKSLLGIINDVLDISKIEAAEMRLERAPFSLRNLLGELGPMMSVQAEAKGITFAVERPADLVDAVEGDATRLRQVLTNLLSNAIKFTSQGEVRLIVSQGDALDDGRLPLNFKVKDTGIGIPAEALERVFQPFAQADTSTTRRYGGTGLGLSIVKQLVSLMDGSVGVQSEPGAGSEFLVDLALMPASEWSLPAAAVQRPADNHALAGLRLLVVDDSELNLEVARRILEMEGAVVTLASDGQQALDRLIADPQGYDLVLMDMQMPVLDGHDATRRIRSALGLTRLPIIALTAGVTVDEQQRAAAAGMNEMVGKPFDPDDLVACILRHVPIPAGLPLRARPRPATAPAASWPAIEGVDMADAQRRLGGDLALMRSLLKRMLSNFADLEAAQAPRADALPELARRLHQLKGSAGTLGAGALESAAVATETACQAGSLSGVGQGLLQLAEQLRALRQASADFLAPPAEPPPAEAAPQPLQPAAIDALHQLLQACDLAALHSMERLAPALRQQLGEKRFAQLRAHVDELAFSEAAEIVGGLLTDQPTEAIA